MKRASKIKGSTGNKIIHEDGSIRVRVTGNQNGFVVVNKGSLVGIVVRPDGGDLIISFDGRDLCQLATVDERPSIRVKRGF